MHMGDCGMCPLCITRAWATWLSCTAFFPGHAELSMLLQVGVWVGRAPTATTPVTRSIINAASSAQHHQPDCIKLKMLSREGNSPCKTASCAPPPPPPPLQPQHAFSSQR